MKSYIAPIAMLCLAHVIFWYKSNSKILFNFDWSPLKWWLYTSLLTNYMTLYAWWRLVEISNVWRAATVWTVCSLAIDLLLNCYYFEYNLKGVVALCLCAIAIIITQT